MKIRVLKSFSGYRVGQVFDWGDGMARIYVARGMAEPVVEIERATVEPVAERAVVRTAVKRKQPK